jgi:hypothetical protein
MILRFVLAVIPLVAGVVCLLGALAGLLNRMFGWNLGFQYGQGPLPDDWRSIGQMATTGLVALALSIWAGRWLDRREEARLGGPADLPHQDETLAWIATLVRRRRRVGFWLGLVFGMLIVAMVVLTMIEGLGGLSQPAGFDLQTVMALAFFGLLGLGLLYLAWSCRKPVNLAHPLMRRLSQRPDSVFWIYGQAFDQGLMTIRRAVIAFDDGHLDYLPMASELEQEKLFATLASMAPNAHLGYANETEQAFKKIRRKAHKRKR